MKKLFSLLLVAALLLTCFPVSVFAERGGLYNVESELFSAQVFDPTQSLCSNDFQGDEFFTANKFGSYLGAGSYRFYDFLTQEQKRIYDAAISMRCGLDGTDYIPANQTNVQYRQSTISGLPEITADTLDNLQALLRPMFATAFNALIDDYPEYFWISLYSYNFYYSNTSDGKVKLGTIYLRIGIYTETSAYTSWDLVEQYYDEINDIVENFNITGNTRYEKLKSMHDQICDMTVYDGNGSMAHEPTGLLLEGKTVCEGYAEVFKMLCDREKIPCISVVGLGDGGAHKWNYVQMEDGRWYGMDVTWDDQSPNTYYDYFLVGSNSKVSNSFGGTKTFGSSHVNQGVHYGNATANVYPTLSTNAYMPLLPMKNSEAVIDSVNGFVIIPKGAVLTSQFAALNSSLSWYKPDTNTATLSGGNTTGATISVTSPVVKTYTVVRRGDVNKDNSVNTADYTRVKNIVTCNEPQFTDRAQKAAADMNGDGVIDAFDALALDIYSRN